MVVESFDMGAGLLAPERYHCGPCSNATPGQTKRGRTADGQPQLPSLAFDSWELTGWESTGLVLTDVVPAGSSGDASELVAELLGHSKKPRLEEADSLPPVDFMPESERPERVTIAFAIRQLSLVRQHVSADKIPGTFRSRLNASQREQIAASDGD